jgi:predicted DNA-binding transcriptional regulator YafY
MNHFSKYLDRLRRLNQYINEGHTGPARELAAKLKISVRTLHNDMDKLEELTGDGPGSITYSSAQKSYIYVSGRIFNFDWGWGN